MNKNQKEKIEEIIKGKEKSIIAELCEFFLDKGLGSVSKTEIDTFIFFILDKYQKEKQINYSNFEWSSILKISERKIKSIRLEAGIRYSADEENDDFRNWIKLLELITDGYLEFIGKDFVIINVEDTYLLRFLEHNLKEAKLSSVDYSFNTERIKLKVTSFGELLKIAENHIGIANETSFASNKFKEAKWTNYRNESLKEIGDLLLKFIPSLVTGCVFPSIPPK